MIPNITKQELEGLDKLLNYALIDTIVPLKREYLMQLVKIALGKEELVNE